tara:strand:+ start:7667 stop:8062 length:396 start_codon:yes stop_codon:yes gene_type:complete
MSIRSELITQLVTNLANTTVRVSTELPYEASGDITLFDKNRNVIYIDDEEEDITELYVTLDSGVVNSTATTVNAYFTADAKNLSIDMNTVITNCLLARNGVTATLKEASVTNEIDSDVITYTFEYLFTNFA